MTKREREEFKGFCRNATDAQCFGIEEKEAKAAEFGDEFRKACLEIIREEIERRNLR